MGKHEVGTPKYIANKIKAKGLQKLRWYCQMCQKQCRDENGFKCHTMSESHQRQLLLFADNADQFIDDFSKEFADGYLELLKRTCGTKRVPANRIYQDYISDRDHLHMNATQWETLTEFVKWLGREGKCVVDETEKGWFVTFIDRDPETIAMQEALAKKEKMNLDDEERMMNFIQKQVERGSKNVTAQPEFTELKRSCDDEVIKVDLNLPTKKQKILKTFAKPASPLTLKMKSDKKRPEPSTSKEPYRKISALEDILREEERVKEKSKRKDFWLHEGIVVKIISSSLGDRYYKKKGVVQEVVGKYAAKVRMLDTGDLIKVDQAHVETVIPAEGRKVRIVNGAYRGEVALMCGLRPDEFCATLEISSGLLKGRVLQKIPYEDFSKLHTS